MLHHTAASHHAVSSARMMRDFLLINALGAMDSLVDLYRSGGHSVHILCHLYLWLLLSDSEEN